MADPVANLVAEAARNLNPATLAVIREFLIANEGDIQPIFRHIIIHEQERTRATAVVRPWSWKAYVFKMIFGRSS